VIFWIDRDRIHANGVRNVVASAHRATLMPLLVEPPENGAIERR